MATIPQYGPIPQQYSAAATVPLIKSPSLWLPQPILLPKDIHPLPDDITAYFVYPFTLEQHVLSTQPSPHAAIIERRARNAEILHRREVEEERKEREALHRVAPGYNPASLLVPTSVSPAPGSLVAPPPAVAGRLSHGAVESQGLHTGGSQRLGADPMDDLVRRLEEMESKR